MPSIFSYFNARIQRFFYPEGSPPQLRAAGRLFSGVSVPLWVVSGIRDDTWLRALGVTVTICAVVCWAVAQLRDADMRTVNRAYADALRRLPEDQRRELLVRAVSGR